MGRAVPPPCPHRETVGLGNAKLFCFNKFWGSSWDPWGSKACRDALGIFFFPPSCPSGHPPSWSRVLGFSQRMWLGGLRLGGHVQARVWGCPRVRAHTGKSKTGSSLSGDGGNGLLLTTAGQCSFPGAVLLRSPPGMGHGHVPCPADQPDPLWGFTPPCFSPRHHPPHPRPDGFHHRGADLR